jgi:hypothetical protein
MTACPVACLGDAPFGYVNVFTSHVNVGFFQGAALCVAKMAAKVPMNPFVGTPGIALVGPSLHSRDLVAGATLH